MMKSATYDFKIIRLSVFETLCPSCQKRVIEAERGAVTSVFFVGRCFIEGKHRFPKNIKTGMAFLDRAVKLKSAEAMEYYGIILSEGELVIKNEYKSIRILTKAVNLFNSCIARVQLARIILSRQKFDIYSNNNNVNFVLAKYYCKEAVSYGSTEGMVLYGKLCMKDKQNKFGIIKSDLYEALSSFKLAANRGNYEAMAEYGRMIELGYGVVRPDPRLAVYYYRKLYEKGDMTGYALYGYALINGTGGIVRNEEEGLELVKKSCDSKNAYGMYIYSNCLMNGVKSLPKNECKAISYVKKAAELGVREAICSLGLYLRDGQGIVKNTVEAIKYLKLAVEEGCAYAASQLGDLFHKGDRWLSIRNINEENKYHKYASNHGDGHSIYVYSRNMLARKGVDLDVKELKRSLIMGTTLDNTECMRLYAQLLLDGSVLPKNEFEAARYLKRAANMGDKHAMIGYAECLERGTGVIKDLDEAFQWRVKSSKI